MGASLGPVLANIIMTELEKAVVDDLVKSGKIKFYVRYVDDNPLLVKSEKLNDPGTFQQFHKNAVDKFDDCVPHFLDLEIHPDGISSIRSFVN